MNSAAEKKVTSSPKEKAEILLRAALSKKARNPVLLELDGLTSIADYFLIVSGTSDRHVKALAEAVLEEAKSSGMPKYSVEGVQQGSWALLDYGDVVAHIFHGPVRDFYDLEGLWAEAPRAELPEDIRREIEALDEGNGDRDDDYEE
jgi:ribosome-associated protein